tara:strand:+ start:23 stop:547 length:525 start_codon:yes stop_codon:yes gene_type:complete
MQIKKTKLKGLKIINNKIYKDSRGHFKEDFKLAFFKGVRFIFSCTSKSKKNVLRGLHMQTKKKQGKFVSVVKGSILDVVVDLRKNSKTFGKHYKIELSDKNGKSIFVPPGFAHGFLARERENIVHYYNTNYRSSKHEIGIMWNDTSLKIKWPIKKPILSKKDKNNLTLKQFLKK